MLTTDSPSPLPPQMIWVSDGGMVYPPTLAARTEIPLSQWLLVKAEDALQVWKVGLEAIQTGLFAGVFLKPTRICPTNHLRRLQVFAERTDTKVFLFCTTKLPHWMCKLKIEDRVAPSSLQTSASSLRGREAEAIPLSLASCAEIASLRSQ